MARAELARFAIGRMGIAQGYSIDRREVARLFVDGPAEADEAKAFFGQFDRIFSFFAADDPRFRAALVRAAGVNVDFYPFRPPGTGHVAECYLRAIGETVTEPPQSRIEPLPEDLAGARDQLSKAGLTPGRLLLILPGSGSAAKNWPATNFVTIARRASARVEVLAVLGPAEMQLGPLFAAHRICTISDLELGEFAAIARLSRGFIGNDSGLTHLAAASGARGLALFGPTDPERWRPLGAVEVFRREPLAILTPDEVWPILDHVVR